MSTIRLNKPATYTELMELTPSLRLLYLDHLVNHYKARRIDIVSMLGIAQTTFAKMLPTLPGKLTFHGRAKQPSAEWTQFINGEAPTPIEEIESAEPPTQIPSATKESLLIRKPSVLPTRITLDFNGGIQQLGELLLVLLNGDQTYHFTVSAE